MSTVTWTLTDADEGLDLVDWSIGPADVAGSPAGWSVSKHRMTGGLRDGVSVIEVDNGATRFSLLPTRGMGLWRAISRDRTLGWRSPVCGPVHPRFVPIAEPSGLGWLSGFNELLVRCGLESNGAPDFDDRGVLKYPLHGRIANLPAHRVTVTVDAAAETIAVTGVVSETRFLFQNLELEATFVTRFGESGFDIRDVVTNRSARPGTMQLLYHINVGQPLLGAGARLHVPAKTVVPRDPHAAEDVANWSAYGPPQAGFEERVYFFDPVAADDGKTHVVLANADSTAGVGLRFNVNELPCFIQWKNTAAVEDGYVTGIEPATNLPNPRSFEAEQGRVVELPPGASHATNLRLDWLHNAASLSTALKAVEELRAGVEPEVHQNPLPDWCA